MNELEEIVNKLDEGSAELNESITLFQKGVTLSKKCQSILEDAEKKVTILTNTDSDNVTEESFEEE